MKTKKQRLKSHIEALEKSYDNIILMLNEDIETDEETKKVKLKDSQRKVYAEGILKGSEAANSLLEMINQKNTELEALENEESDLNKKEKEKIKMSKEHPTQKHLK